MLTEKDHCDYETSVALGDLGMPIDTLPCEAANKYKEPELFYVSPSLYSAQKWLREEKGIIVEIFVDDDSDTPITYNIHKDGECICHHHGKYWSIKEWNVALLEGIKEAVKILKDETIHE